LGLGEARPPKPQGGSAPVCDVFEKWVVKITKGHFLAKI
jgi:hypothetical protein